MSSKTTLLLSFALFLAFFKANAGNVTKVLGQFSDFSTFNDYLSKSGLAAEINSRQTLTILAVDNGNMGSLSGKSNNAIKNIMSLHVILDYYDVKKFENLPNRTAIVTTLFQSSGQASGQLGFLNVTDVSPGNVAFGSAQKGESMGSNLVKSVVSQPYNLSIVQISSVIMPTGIDKATSKNSTSSPSPSPTSGPKKSPSPRKSPTSDSPSPSDGSPPKRDSPPAADEPSADTSHSEGTMLRLTIFLVLVTVFSSLWLVSTV